MQKEIIPGAYKKRLKKYAFLSRKISNYCNSRISRLISEVKNLKNPFLKHSEVQNISVYKNKRMTRRIAVLSIMQNFIQKMSDLKMSR